MNKKRVFAFPGNPVSALSCCHRYLIPQLQDELGFAQKSFNAELLDEFNFGKPLTYFLPVKLKTVDGELKANIVKMNGSGDFCGLAESDGFLELAAEKDKFPVGHKARVFSWNPNFK